MAPAAQAFASSLSISPQPTIPASVEIFTNTQEFFRTKDSTLVTLTLSFGPTAAALVRSTVNSRSRVNRAPDASAPLIIERRSIGLAIARYLHAEFDFPASSSAPELNPIIVGLVLGSILFALCASLLPRRRAS